MLCDYVPIPTLGVEDVERARSCYEGVLGFTPMAEVPDGVMYRTGISQFLVYPSAHAGSNRATAMAVQIPVGAFDAEVAALRDNSVVFQYQLAGGVTQVVVAQARGAVLSVLIGEDPGTSTATGRAIAARLAALPAAAIGV